MVEGPFIRNVTFVLHLKGKWEGREGYPGLEQPSLRQNASLAQQSGSWNSMPEAQRPSGAGLGQCSSI